MSFLQDFIHKLEVAGRGRIFRYVLVFLTTALLIVAYNFCCYRNLSAPEAMDAAQLGRNLAEGRGYTTLFIRPLSMGLLTRHHEARSGLPEVGQRADYSQISGPHPDIANPPVYPLVLAGLMKVLPFNYALPSEGEKQKAFWSSNGHFWRYQPDFLIALFNEFLFLIVIVLTFFWARRLFDATAAWISAVLLLGAEMLWRFSVSGLPTMLLLVIFMGIVWCLTLLERENWEPKRGTFGLFALAIAAGALTGLGGLTHYSFAWLILPVLVFLRCFAGARWLGLCVATFAVFAVVLTPWMIRNWHLSGTPFGTATYSLLSGTDAFPEHHLERSLNPDIDFLLQPLRVKLFTNLRRILQNDLFNLGGGWVTAFFLTGLMIAFRNPTVRRLRYFLLMALGVFAGAQALGGTQLSVDSPWINSENMLVLLTPLMVVYAVGFFLLLLDQLNLRVFQLRHAVVVSFVLLSCLPLIFALLPPRTIPVVYPPYNPPGIQRTAALLKEDELMMSDVPWAVAWYGRRPCLWLTLHAMPDPKRPDSLESFSAINDFQRNINALYLSPAIMDGRFVSEWYRAGDLGWGYFLLTTIQNKAPPPNFPLRELPGGYLPEQLFLADQKRW